MQVLFHIKCDFTHSILHAMWLNREHYQWNMDVWGVKGVEAEAEVLSALVSSLRAMGLTANDVGIRVRNVYQISSHCDMFTFLHYCYLCRSIPRIW